MIMRTLIALLLLLPATMFGAVEYDSVKGIDPTGLTRVTPSQLSQLVDNATTATNKGMIIRKTTRPDVTLNPRYTNFMWLDSSLGAPATLKQYVCCGDADTNWVAGTLGAGSINSTMLQDASVIAGKISANGVNTTNISDNAVTDTKINAGAVTSNKVASASITSDKIVAGTISTINIGTNQITTALIADSAITTIKLSDSLITSNKIALTNVTNDKLTGDIDVTKLSSGAATNGQVLRYSASVIGFGTPTITYRSSATVFAASDIAVVGLSNVTHNLGGVPDLVRLVLVNKANTAGAGYTVGDEVDAQTCVGNNSTFQNIFNYLATTTTFTVSTRLASGPPSVYIVNKTGAATTTYTPAQLVNDWNVKCLLFKFSP